MHIHRKGLFCSQWKCPIVAERSLGRIPRIEESNAHTLKIAHIPGDQRQAMLCCRCGNQRIMNGDRIWHMITCADAGNHICDREKPFCKSRHNMIFQPCPQEGTLADIPALGEAHADFKFMQGNHREIKVTGINTIRLCSNMAVGLPGRDLAQL